MTPEVRLATVSAKDRQGSIRILNALLADEFLLYTKTRNYHWNVTGETFGPLHQLFNEQYDALNTIVDDVAERIRALGGTAPGSLGEFLDLARIKETPAEPLSAAHMIGNLLADYESVIEHLRSDLVVCLEKYHDVGTNNFLANLLERHEKTAWMLRAHL